MCFFIFAAIRRIIWHAGSFYRFYKWPKLNLVGIRTRSVISNLSGMFQVPFPQNTDRDDEYLDLLLFPTPVTPNSILGLVVIQK